MSDLRIAVMSFAAAIGFVTLLVLELVLDTDTGPTSDDPNDYVIRDLRQELFDRNEPT